jgi:hypothetical protein
LKRNLVIAIILLLVLTTFPMLIGGIRAHDGLKSSTTSWFWERFNSKHGNSTSEFVSEYITQTGTTAEDAVKASEATTQPPFVQYIIIFVFVRLEFLWCI